ncbi:MAG: DUF502 domain-containing protein [Halothiobacillaceae bacterium]|nr:MAG: DUF502 domain-containing protein [Halothiobacillaceae bacterium]
MSDPVHASHEADAPVTHSRGPVAALRRYLVAGLLVWAPLLLTWWIMVTLVDLMDRTLLLLPPEYRPDALLPFHVPGLGVILALTVLLATGIIAANILGRRLVALWESMLERIPLVRSIYSAAKQLLQTFLSSDSKSFRKVLLIEYPSRGLWTLAFLAGEPVGEVQAKTARDMLTVYVPTAPNPTSGYVIFIARDDVIELDMGVEDAMRMIISLGMVAPGNGRAGRGKPVAAPPAKA